MDELALRPCVIGSSRRPGRLCLDGPSLLTVDGPKPDAQRHGLLRDRARRSTKFLGRLTTREAVISKAAEFSHIIRGPRTRDSSFLFLPRHYCLV